MLKIMQLLNVPLLSALLSNLCVLSCLLVTSTNANAKGQLSDNIRIDSKVLGYALQYRVYQPQLTTQSEPMPTIYFTDGQWYLSQGKLIEVLDSEIATGNIEPVVAVFVDNRNPDDLLENRRNSQFMCNKDYVAFFTQELVPTVTANFPVSTHREDRVIAGISFGGLNAGCFGLLAPKTFGGIGMQSPANSYHLKLLRKLYNKNETQPVKMFFSTGTKKDNEKAARRLHQVLVEKGYFVNYIEVPFGHEWANWQPLMDDLLQTFFKKQ